MEAPQPQGHWPVVRVMPIFFMYAAVSWSLLEREPRRSLADTVVSFHDQEGGLSPFTYSWR